MKLFRRGAPPKVRILCVDEDPTVCQSTGSALLRDDREIFACESAAEALLEFAGHRYDVVIADSDLGCMSGVDLAQTIAAISPRAYVIIASDAPLQTQSVPGHGRVHTVGKPVDAAAMNRLIDACVNPGIEVRE